MPPLVNSVWEISQSFCYTPSSFGKLRSRDPDLLRGGAGERERRVCEKLRESSPSTILWPAKITIWNAVQSVHSLKLSLNCKAA